MYCYPLCNLPSSKLILFVTALCAMIDSKNGDLDNRQENVLEFVTKLPDATLHIRDQLMYKKSVDETFIHRRCETCCLQKSENCAAPNSTEHQRNT